MSFVRDVLEGFQLWGKWLMQSNIITRVSAFFVTNPVVLWFCAGVCKGQLNLIRKEDNIYNYVVRCLNSTAEYSHLRDSNYFYWKVFKALLPPLSRGRSI